MGTFIDENTKAPGFGRRGLLVCAYLLGDRRGFHFRLLSLVLRLFGRLFLALLCSPSDFTASTLAVSALAGSATRLANLFS
jgi:hypothetical protein